MISAEGTWEGRCSRSGDGLTRRERIILDKWDEGLTLEQIADTTALPLNAVTNICQTMLPGNEDRMARQAMATGSAALLAAMSAA